MATKTIQESIAALQQTKNNIESKIASRGGTVPSINFKFSDVSNAIDSIPSAGLFNLSTSTKIYESNGYTGGIVLSNSLDITFNNGSSGYPLSVKYKIGPTGAVSTTSVHGTTTLRPGFGCNGFRMIATTEYPYADGFIIISVSGTTLSLEIPNVSSGRTYEIILLEKPSTTVMTKKIYQIVALEY